MLCGILFVLFTGIRWEWLPSELGFGCGMTCWRRLRDWQEAGTRRQVALFPAGSMPADDVDAIGVRVSELSLRRPRQWGACWLALSGAAWAQSGKTVKIICVGKKGYDILRRSPGISQIALDITRHHHERMDGTGYPDKLPGSDISELAKMAAIVDVYDAITADRCYHKGMPAASALRKLHEWSKHHFDPQLVQAFMRCVGIYPVGTLVLLESGRLGVVVEPHESNLLAPKVNVFFHAKRNVHIRPELVDLSRGVGAGGADRIVSHENPARWNVDPARFMVPA